VHVPCLGTMVYDTYTSMMESNRQGSEQGTPGPVFPPYTQHEGVKSVGGASGEITSPSTTADDLPPDPLYGDAAELPAGVAPSELSGHGGDRAPGGRQYTAETDDGIAYIHHPPARDIRASLPIPHERPTAVARVNERPLPDQRPIVKGWFRIVIDGQPKHGRSYTVREPQTPADEQRLVRAYFEAVRDQGPYDKAVPMNQNEHRYYTMYRAAQTRVAERLRVTDSVEYDIDKTPYHVFNDKAAMHAVVRRMMSEKSITPGNGIYSPLTGALWVRTADPAEMERGFARLSVESSAAFVGMPPVDQRERVGPQEVGYLLNLGTGYARSDLVKDYINNDGFNRAVTDMAVKGLMQEAGSPVAPRYRSLGINVVLDCVIREAARRFPRPEVTQSVVANSLLKGYYNGDTQYVQALRKLFPHIGIARMLRMDGGERAWDLQVIEQALGVSGIAERYRRIRAGEPARLYEWDDEPPRLVAIRPSAESPRLPGGAHRQIGS
jgi:hypothetical protein